MSNKNIRGQRTDEIIELGFLEKEDGKKHQSKIVYSTNGVAPTICAGCGVKYWINVLVKECKETSFE